jgi:hypothetical protein
MEVSTTPIDEKPKNKFVYTHEWYLEHKDVINRRNRESYHKNKPPLKEKKTPIFNRKEYISEYRKNNMDKPYYQYDAEYQYREKKKLEKQQTV